MKRTQVQLPEDHHRQLRALAEQLGVSMAEVIRRVVADCRSREEVQPTWDERVQAALAACGKYRDPRGATDVAAQHDEHLAEAYRS